MCLKTTYGVDKMIGLHVPNRVIICVDRWDNANIAGRIFHRLSPQAVLFQEINELLLEMEKLFDQLGIPQASTENRYFETYQRQGSGADEKKRQKREELSPMAKDTAQQKGKKATFVVQVQYRQNATWQGTVVWTEKEETKRFRSALELLKLMDSAIAPDEEESAPATNAQ